MVQSLNKFLEETVFSKRLRSKLLTSGIQIALPSNDVESPASFASDTIITHEASSSTFAATELWPLRSRHGREFLFANRQLFLDEAEMPADSGER